VIRGRFVSDAVAGPKLDAHERIGSPHAGCREWLATRSPQGEERPQCDLGRGELKNGIAARDFGSTENSPDDIE
jgi:hypothetical protein